MMLSELTAEKAAALAVLFDRDPQTIDDLLRQLQNIAGTTKEQRGIAEARMLIRTKATRPDDFFDGLSAALTARGSYEYHF